MSREIERRIERLESEVDLLLLMLTLVLDILTPDHKAHTKIFPKRGEIRMQTTLKSLPGTDTLTFQTFDNSTPPVDITSRCSYAVSSDGPAVAVGTVTPNSAEVTYSAGTANITISTTDSGGDKIPDVVLAATIAAPAAGTTTVTAANPSTTIS